MGAKDKIMAVQSQESDEYADRDTAVQVHLYSFEFITGGCESCQLYEDAGGSFYLKPVIGGADSGPAVVTPLVGETYVGYYLRDEEQGVINGRPYYINFIKKSILVWDLDKYSLSHMSCRDTMVAAGTGNVSVSCLLASSTNSPATPDTSTWGNPGWSFSYSIERKTGNVGPVTESSFLQMKEWSQPFSGNVRAIFYFNSGGDEFITMADSKWFYVFKWIPTTREIEGYKSNPYALTAHPHTNLTDDNPAVYHIFGPAGSDYLIYTTSASFYIFGFDKLNKTFIRPTLMDSFTSGKWSNFWFKDAINTYNILSVWGTTFRRHDITDLRRSDTLGIKDTASSAIGPCIYHGSGLKFYCSTYSNHLVSYDLDQANYPPAESPMDTSSGSGLCFGNCKICGKFFGQKCDTC